MSLYYRTNAIYEALSKIQHDFQWVSGNAWLLVYGNKKDSTAKVIVLAYGTSWKIQDSIMQTLSNIAKISMIPIYAIRFNDTEGVEISDVEFSPSLQVAQTKITLNELKKKFIDVGLQIKEGACDKYLNDKASSAYHTWQRNSLGNEITVTDIDLIRTSNNMPIELIELKRSTANVKSWSPYSDDFINFNLLYTISQNAKIPFSIVYNRMVKEPFNDIYTPVSIFSYSRSGCKEIIRDYPFSDFVKGLYHKVKNATVDQKSICQKCQEAFEPRIPGALLCINCWKEERGRNKF